jgi:hypothetical protein
VLLSQGVRPATGSLDFNPRPDVTSSALLLRCVAWHQQPVDGLPQGHGEAFHAVHGDIPLPSLHRAHISAMQTRQISQLLLGESACFSGGPEIGRKNQARTSALRGSRHLDMLVVMMTLALQTISSF